MNTSANQNNFIAFLVIFVVGAVYLSVKFVSLYGTFAVDFDYIWLSGKVWLTGENPYSAAYGETARSGDLFKGTKPPELFSYPFNWSLPAMALAKLPLETATFIWRAAAIITLVPSVLLIFFASRHFMPSLRFSVVLIVLAYLFLMQATAISLANGQTGWIVLLGLSLIFYGIASERTPTTVLGLTLIMLKPNIGIPLLATLAVVPRQWPAIAIAGVLSIGLAVPAFMTIGIPATVKTFLETIPSYSIYAVNGPASMTGIRNLIWELVGRDMNSVLLLAVASLAAVVSTIALGRTAGQHTHFVMRALFLTLAIILVVIPLHTYDFVIVAPFIVLFLGAQHTARWLILIALAITFRSDNLGNWLGLYGEGKVFFPGSILNSLASIPLIVGTVWLLCTKSAIFPAVPLEKRHSF